MNRAIYFVALIQMLLVTAVLAKPHPYDPLAITGKNRIQQLDTVVHDTTRQRKIPLLIYLPSQKSPAPVVLFSHGLGGSRKGNAYLGKHWAARGYLAVFVQHRGSDTSVWKDKPRNERMAAMKQAANLQNSLLRVKDIFAVLDQLERWNLLKGHALAGRLDLEHIGMSGHSFGASTTQLVSGQRLGRWGVSFTDSRIKAAVMLSPSSPRRGDPKEAFGHIKMPWMLMTGTRDVSLIAHADAKSRLAVFTALKPREPGEPGEPGETSGGGKYEVVLENAEHSAFSDRSLPGDTQKRNPNHHRVVLALSTAFWDTYLHHDAAAKAWLDGDGPRSVLEKKDRWQTK